MDDDEEPSNVILVKATIACIFNSRREIAFRFPICALASHLTPTGNSCPIQGSYAGSTHLDVLVRPGGAWRRMGWGRDFMLQKRRTIEWLMLYITALRLYLSFMVMTIKSMHHARPVNAGLNRFRPFVRFREVY